MLEFAIHTHNRIDEQLVVILALRQTLLQK